MTDTTPGGWPDAARPGYPLNPERDGWHWLRHEDASFCTPVEWRHPCGWVANGVPMLPNEVQKFVVDCCQYLGPCHAPAEVSAQVEAARRDALEEAARVVEAEPEFPGRAPLVMWAVPTALTARSICRATKRNAAGAIRARGDA
jgi:hypothetical protein